MAYTSKEKTYNKKGGLITAGLFIAAVFAIGGFFSWQYIQQSTESAPELVTSTPPEGGVVAVLGEATRFTSSDDAATAQLENQDSTAYSNEPYTLNLPAGWSEVGSDTKKDPCGGDKEWLTTTYVKGAESLVVYENGNPTGCEGATIADVYMDFSYSEDARSIEVNKQRVVQCTKEQNAACPRGDGQVSIFIGNENTESTEEKYKVNPLNGRTYFFSLTDTEIDANFTAQVIGLAEIVENITFK